MSNPGTREQLRDWCLRQLGHPVIDINVDDEQVEDAIDSAFQYFRDFHYDAIERWYLPYKISATDITNKYITIPDEIVGINRIFSLSSTNASVNMFDLRYQMRLHELYDFTSTSYVNYVITQQHIRTLDLLFSGETPVRFNRHSSKLYIDWDWNNKVDVDEWIVIEGFLVLDPETYTKIYNDRLLKKLATAYLKKQWGNNMKKYTGMKLPGGIEMNGQQIYNEAVAEISDIETLIRNTHEAPPQFIMG